MMMDTQEVLPLIFAAIDEHNEVADSEMRLDKSAETVLFGRSGRLDSLALVSLIVAIEQRVEEHFGKPVSIASEKALSQERSPFRTIGSLATYITELLRDGCRE
jgi:acyl carrier protein